MLFLWIVRNKILIHSGILLLISFMPTGSVAQRRVAEGEYEMHALSGGGAPLVKTTTRWNLYSKSSGGYEVRSEIQNMPDGKRLVQIEDLDEHLIPISTGYELFLKSQTRAILAIKCQFSESNIICSGRHDDKTAAPSKAFEVGHPFWLWVKNMFTLDMPWLVGGGVNMARLENGKSKLSIISVSGGGDTKEWVFVSEDEGLLELVGVEKLEWNGTTIAAKHYSIRSGDDTMNLWVAASGIPVKLSGYGNDEDLLLTKYKQYERLIPELQVEGEYK
jgi:hypothetical protein